MNRLAWMSLGGVLALAGSVGAFALAPRLGLEDSPAATDIFALVAALLAFYVISFVLPACLACMQLATANGRLARLVAATHERAPCDPGALCQALGGSCLGDLAHGYAATLRPPGPGELWRGRDPDDAFAERSVIEDRLMTGFHCRFATVFIALAVIALLLGCADIIDNGLTSVTAMTELRATLLSSAAAFAAAAVAFLAQPLLTGLCQIQLRRFVRLLGRIYAIDDGSHELRELVEGVTALRRDIADRSGDAPSGEEVALPRLRSAASRHS